MNITISIGNSDDKLPQREWARFISAMRSLLKTSSFKITIHGEWFSAPDAQWQNANWCIEMPTATGADFEQINALKAQLRLMAGSYDQDSIAFTPGLVEFLTP